MMLEIVIGDRVRKVSVTQQGALLHVILDGRTHLVDARRVGNGVLSLLVQSNGDARPVRSIEAAILARNGNGDLDVHVSGRTVPVQVREPSSRASRTAASGGKPGSGPQRVIAPMPGKIVRVLVKAGDEVKPRQGLVVVEAMKMENELRAAREGRVREVSVVEGQSVEAGAVLVVVE
jgi:biotin carboxyl carrier protein